MSTLAHKICPAHELGMRLVDLPRPLVMTNGVFDVLHRGHVDYLHHAAQLGGSLLVAVNTDASTRLLGKGPDRPLNKDQDRAFVLAGLASVSMVTLFDSKTPVDLIRSVQPDIYVKGCDYDMEKLEETHIVRSWGGRSVSIPFVEGFSTTAIVQRIRQPALRKAVFLDRDGVINRDHGYVYRWEDFEFIPGAIDAMRLLREAGYALVIVTNQSGIARGYYTEKQYEQLTAALQAELSRQGVSVDGIYHCPHHRQGTVAEYAIDCDCRKPATGLILQATRELGLSLPDSLLIGDKSTDMRAAMSAGVGRACLLGAELSESLASNKSFAGAYANLWECAQAILHTQKACE